MFVISFYVSQKIDKLFFFLGMFKEMSI